MPVWTCVTVDSDDVNAARDARASRAICCIDAEAVAPAVRNVAGIAPAAADTCRVAAVAEAADLPIEAFVAAAACVAARAVSRDIVADDVVMACDVRDALRCKP